MAVLMLTVTSKACAGRAMLRRPPANGSSENECHLKRPGGGGGQIPADDRLPDCPPRRIFTHAK